MSDQRSKRRYWRREVIMDDRWGLPGWLPLLGLLLAFLWGLFMTAPSIEASTRDRVSETLAAAGYTGLEVDVSGQEVSIRGAAAASNVSSSEHTARIASIARGAACDDGWFARDLVCPTSVVVDGDSPNEVAELDSAPAVLTEGAERRAHDFRIRRSADGTILLEGDVPDTATRDQIVREAQSRSRDGSVEDQLRITGESAGPHDEWATTRAWNVLEGIQTGGVSWERGEFSAWGRLPQANFAGVQSAFAIDIGGEGRGRLGSLDLQVIEDVDRCNDEFAAALASSTIQFQTGSAKISAESQGLLARLALVARACPIVLNVEGHTDSVGSEDFNMNLSRARADSVVVGLVAAGADGDLLRPQGFGPSQPAASNETADGRAQNRRIEIRAAEIE